jgi:hypothetical protein
MCVIADAAFAQAQSSVAQASTKMSAAPFSVSERSVECRAANSTQWRRTDRTFVLSPCSDAGDTRALIYRGCVQRQLRHGDAWNAGSNPVAGSRKKLSAQAIERVAQLRSVGAVDHADEADHAAKPAFEVRSAGSIL